MATYKVVDADALDADITSVADAIRGKTGTSDSLVFPDGLIEAVESVCTADSVVDKSITAYSSSSVTTIPRYMFYECKSLVSVDIPNVTLIQTYGFALCEKLESIILPNVQELATRAFNTAATLALVDLGAITKIGTFAFYSCEKLDTIIIRSESVPTLSSYNAFNNTPIGNGEGYIYVPTSLIAEYESATNWATWVGFFRAIEDYPDITGGTV